MYISVKEQCCDCIVHTHRCACKKNIILFKLFICFLQRSFSNANAIVMSPLLETGRCFALTRYLKADPAPGFLEACIQWHSRRTTGFCPWRRKVGYRVEGRVHARAPDLPGICIIANLWLHRTPPPPPWTRHHGPLSVSEMYYALSFQHVDQR